MTQVEAIYHNGVFTPLQDVGLRDNQRVRLSIQPVEAGNIREWLAQVQAQQKHIVAERGYFPDSTASITEDRKR
jgi:predicted DNA-binding antitoxin AbrB/MazE fold protein